MKILERYILRSYLASLLWCLSIFLGLYLILDLLGHLDEILRNHLSMKLLLHYYGTMVPLIFVQVAPFGCLMATLYTMGNLNRHQELMAMRASGLSPWAIARPLLALGILMSALVGLVNEWIAPQAALTTRTIKANHLERPQDPNKPHEILKEIQHLTIYGEGQSLIYAETFDPVKKRLGGVVILQHGKDLRLIRKIFAKEAFWIGNRWRFLEGTILHFDLEGRSVGRPVPFLAKILDVVDRPEILAKSESQAEFMNSRDLASYIERLRSAGGKTIRKLQVDLYAKSAAALACLVLTLVGIPFAIQPVRGGTVLGLSFGLGVGLVYYGVNALTIAMGKGGWLPPLTAAWGTHLGFGVLGLNLIWKRLA